MKPDFVAYVNGTVKQEGILTAEFKGPNGRCAGIRSDLVKLGQQMKYMLDCLIAERVPSPVVCGVLVESRYLYLQLCKTLTLAPSSGDNWRTFKMDMKNPRIYRLIHLRGISFIKDISQLSSLPLVVQGLWQLKVSNRSLGETPSRQRDHLTTSITANRRANKS